MMGWQTNEYIIPLSEDEAFYGYKDMTTELIRCKDCALSRKTVTKDVVVCIRHGFGTHEDPDGYCYKAKRKEDNDKTD